MLTKEKLLASIKAMPEEEFEDIDVLFERIVILQKIEKAEKDTEDGKFFLTRKPKKSYRKG